MDLVIWTGVAVALLMSHVWGYERGYRKGLADGEEIAIRVSRLKELEAKQQEGLGEKHG